MLRKTVPDPYNGDWKSSVSVGWESGMGNRQFMRRIGTQMPLKPRCCWMMKFVSEVWQCQAMKTFCKPERPACNLSAMELSASVIHVGATWCDRTLLMRRRTVQPHSPLYLYTCDYFFSLYLSYQTHVHVDKSLSVYIYLVTAVFDLVLFFHILYFSFYYIIITEPCWIGPWPGWLTILLQCCETVGGVIWSVKLSL